MAEDTDPKRVVGRIVASMLLVGFGVGLASLLAWEWIDAVIVPDVDGVQANIIGNYTPLVFIIISTISAAVSAAVLGIFEGLRTSELKSAAFIAAGCLIGGVLLVVVAGVFINFTGMEVEGSESAEITILDLVSLAGLAGAASAPIGALTSLLGAK
jgi:hypothetical protein